MYLEDSLMVLVCIDTDGTDIPVLSIARKTKDNSLRIINTITGEEAIQTYCNLIEGPNDNPIVTYGDIYSQFLESTKIDKSIVEDWRPCFPPYYDIVVNMAIVVWLKDGNKLVYRYKKKWV